MTYLVFRRREVWRSDVESLQLVKKRVNRYYAYLVKSTRRAGRVTQDSMFAFPVEQWNMKELVYLLTGETPFSQEHRERFAKDSQEYCRALSQAFDQWQASFGWTRDYIVRRYAEGVACKSCVYEWVREHGMPDLFREVFLEHGVLDAVLKWLDKWRSNTETVSLQAQEAVSE